MTNSRRGEAAIGGHKLVVDFNGWCVLEEETGRKVPELLALMDAGLGFSELRTCIRVFLEDDMTLAEVGDLIGEQGYEASLKALSLACGGFFAPRKEKKENPPKAE